MLKKSKLNVKEKKCVYTFFINQKCPFFTHVAMKFFVLHITPSSHSRFCFPLKLSSVLHTQGVFMFTQNKRERLSEKKGGGGREVKAQLEWLNK
jgi:hypothetical protein